MKAVKILQICSLLFISYLSFATERVNVSVSEQDAKIYVDGVLSGNGVAKINVPKGECVNIRVEKVGFLTVEKNYCKKKGSAEPPEKDFIKMEADDAFTSSISTDIANRDITIKVDAANPNGWKNINQIVVSYFDVIELSDKETSYLRTAWSVQTFKSATVRSRLIVKGDPNGFRVKLVSEISKDPNATVKNDEAFKEWDRVVRKYESLIVEIQARMK